MPMCVLTASLVAVMTLTKGQFEPIIPWLFCLCVACVSALQEKAWLKRLLSHRFLVYLGTISYSLYLTHAIVIIVYLDVLRRVMKTTIIKDDAGRILNQTTPLNTVLLILGGLVVTIGVSHLTYHFIENRFRRGLRKQPSIQKVPTTSTV